MNTYVLLSSLDSNIKCNIIQKSIISLSNKKKPKILYIPAASLDSNLNIMNFTKCFTNLEVTIDICYLTTEETSQVNQRIEGSDIIFFGGGNTIKLLELMKKHQIDKLLRNINHKIICGLSAGANVISRYGIADSSAFFDRYKFYNFKEVEGLGFLNIFVCAHFNKNELIEYNDILKTKQVDAFAIEDNTAIIFKENKINIVKNDSSKAVYYYLYKENFIMKEIKEGIYYEYNRNN